LSSALIKPGKYAANSGGNTNGISMITYSRSHGGGT
jgi:hypothetical protein